MKKADLKVYEERLRFIKARLRGDVTAMADVALRKSGTNGSASPGMPTHMAEQGSENFAQEFTLSLMASEEDTLTQIDVALTRIKEGSYGACAECGGVIPKQRLNALPHTSHCVKCAEIVQNGSK